MFKPTFLHAREVITHIGPSILEKKINIISIFKAVNRQFYIIFYFTDSLTINLIATLLNRNNTLPSDISF